VKITNNRRQMTSVQDLLCKGPLNVGSYFKLSPETKLSVGLQKLIRVAR
jgi:hypothetical protein